MTRRKAILPTRDISKALSELILELDIPELEYDRFSIVLIDGALAFNDVNWANLNEVIYNNLKVMGEEIGPVTKNVVPLCEVPNLLEGLSTLARKLYRTMVTVELDRYNNDPEQDWPRMSYVEISKSGDMVVEIHN